jgi:hypothetical protein
MFALNPITLAAFAIGGAFEIFQKRVEMATEALSDVQMPDLTPAIDQANQLATAWEEIKSAVDDVFSKWNSADSTFNRDKSGIDVNRDQGTKLLGAQKQKADADLEAQKGSMDPATYAARKQEIENSFAGQQKQAEQNAQLQEMAAKYREKANAEIAAQASEHRAAAVKLPEDDKVFAAQQDALQKAADNFRATAKKARGEADAVQETRSESETGPRGFVKALGGTAEFLGKYGLGPTGGDVIKMQTDRALSDEQNAAAIEKQIAARQTEFEQRKKLREEAVKDASLAAGLGLEVPADCQAFDKNATAQKQTAVVQNAANAEKTATDFLNANPAAKQTVEQLRSHIAENQRLQTELQKASAELIASHAGSTEFMVQTLNQLRREMDQIKSRVDVPFGQ